MTKNPQSATTQSAETQGSQAESRTPSALTVLRRGIRETPELRRGFVPTVAAALLSSAGQLVLPVVVQQSIDRGFSERADGSTAVDLGQVLLSAAAGGVILLLVFALDRVALWRLLRAGEHALSSLRVRAFNHIHSLSIAEHSETRRGQLTARVTSDTETLSRFLQWGALTWVRQTAVIVGAFAAMYWYSWKLATIVAVVYLPLLPILRFVQRRQFVAYGKVRSSVGATIGVAAESISGAATIRAYDYQEHIAEALETSSRELTNNQIRAHRFFSILSPLLFFFGAVAIGASILTAVYIGTDGLTVGQFGAFLFLLTILIGPIGQLAEVLDQTQTAMAGWWKIQNLFDIELEIVDPVDGVELGPEPPTVEFDSVEFRYRTGEQVLHNLSFVVPAGATVALVGETGSGKTTAAKLLARLADPTAGAVKVGGVDLRLVAAECRQRTIRMVPQDGFLFNTTVSENIRFGKPDATDEDVALAAERLGLTDWLERQGLDTQVGERGDNVSVGERQLIALLRAQVADAGLLILDEATSSVDPEIEQHLAEALARLSQGRTTISIAHRMSTAERADLILVLDNGRLVEEGTHDSLLEAGSFYHDLYYALDSAEAPP